MGKDINSAKLWGDFVERLAEETNTGAVKWQQGAKSMKRDGLLGPVYFSEVRAHRWVAVYRYEYRDYTDVDEWEIREDVAIELVDEDGTKLWQLPRVGQRYSLIDAIEFVVSDAEGFLKDVLESNN